MTLPTSGTLSLSAINAEFALGNNLGAYRGIRWYKDDNSRGYFDNNASGNGPPIDISEFYGTRKTIPVVPTGDVSYGNGSYFVVPFYNRLIINLQGGGGGQGGAVGYYSQGYYNGVLTPGGSGGSGGTTSFGTWVSAGGGAGGGGGGNSGAAGGTASLIIDAATTPGAPLKGVQIYITVGSGGGGGGGGPIYSSTDGKYGYALAGYAASGSAGSAGYVTVKVE